MNSKHCYIAYVLYLIDIDDRDKVYIWTICQIKQESFSVVPKLWQLDYSSYSSLGTGPKFSCSYC